MYKLPLEGADQGMKSLSSCDNDSINSSSKLSSMHRNSHNCGKSSSSQPKIRIIHIIAPEIIKTDVENFRDLVQRLTGRHAAADEGKGSGGCSSKINAESPPAERMKMMRSHLGRMKGEKEDDEHQVYGGGFGMDGFVVEDFCQLPAAVFPFKPSHLNAVFGEMPLF
ncbi:VQ motif-containing protein 17-like [Ipomoea triloba]|uniref:VQ motif-containing protein 17-like n=1 Tax=Ipomoea triloba TaxID=35885 RepID=UPI00125E38B4|nr:VQ motif-containing protein 17-like [Ipomoea triloba]